VQLFQGLSGCSVYTSKLFQPEVGLTRGGGEGEEVKGRRGKENTYLWHLVRCTASTATEYVCMLRVKRYAVSVSSVRRCMGECVRGCMGECECVRGCRVSV